MRGWLFSSVKFSLFVDASRRTKNTIFRPGDLVLTYKKIIRNSKKFENLREKLKRKKHCSGDAVRGDGDRSREKKEQEKRNGDFCSKLSCFKVSLN